MCEQNFEINIIVASGGYIVEYMKVTYPNGLHADPEREFVREVVVNHNKLIKRIRELLGTDKKSEKTEELN